MSKEKWKLRADPEPLVNSAFILLERDDMLEGWGNVWPDNWTVIDWLAGTRSEGHWNDVWDACRIGRPGVWSVQQVQNA